MKHKCDSPGEVSEKRRRIAEAINRASERVAKSPEWTRVDFRVPFVGRNYYINRDDK